MKGYFIADIMRGLKNVVDNNKLKKLIKEILTDMFDDEKLVEKYKKMIGYQESEQAREKYRQLKKITKSSKKSVSEEIINLSRNNESNKELYESKFLCDYCGECFHDLGSRNKHRIYECPR